MSIKILEINKNENDESLVTIKHCNEIFKAKVNNDTLLLKNNYDTEKEILVEIDYTKIESFEIIENYFDEQSIIQQFNNNDRLIELIGRIHNIIDCDDEKIIDIYLMNGCEFLAISSKDINNVSVRIDDGIKLIIRDLCFYPNN